MSKEEDKFKHSKRLLKDENAIKKQVKIAKEHGVPIKDPHRLEKHHAMDCGNPKCMLCSNPRRTWNELTIQEKRKFQEIEIARMRHSNGTLVDDNE
jgi:hypothetical protein